MKSTVPIDKYWGEIRSATAQHATTAQLWSSVKDALARDGYSGFEKGSFVRMNQLRGLASSQQYTMEALAKAADDASLDSRFIAQDIDSGPLDFQALSKEYKVQYEHLINVGGEDKTVWRTDFFSSLPGTKGELIAELQDEGDMLTQTGGTDEGADHVGIGNVLITEI